MIPFIKTEPDKTEFCCVRYYFYSLHSWKCRQANRFEENTDIGYAEANKNELETKNN